jgi:hypothetical protein
MTLRELGNSLDEALKGLRSSALDTPLDERHPLIILGFGIALFYLIRAVLNMVRR